jgi:threonine/homoserine/homoserine lactone efflux protein
MNTMLPLIGRGILLGLGAAVPIGPVNVEIARRTLRGGFAAGFAIGAGAATIDMSYALLSCLSLGQLLTHRAIFWPLNFGGIVLLTYMGIQCLRAAWTKPTIEIESASPPRASLRSGYLVGLLMTLLNPMTLAFWFVVLPTAAGPIAAANPARQLPLICVGVFIGTLGWAVSFAGTLSILGRFRRGLWLIVADTVGGVFLLSFATAAFLRSIAPFL